MSYLTNPYMVTPASSPAMPSTCTGFNTEYDPSSTGDSNIRATKLEATASGNVTHLSCELENATGNVIMALYADDGGTPGSNLPDALLGKTLETACVAGVNKIELIDAVSVSSGTVVWIAFQNSVGNNVKLSFTAPAGTSYYATNTPVMVIQDPFPSGHGLLARGYQLCISGS